MVSVHVDHLRLAVEAGELVVEQGLAFVSLAVLLGDDARTFDTAELLAVTQQKLLHKSYATFTYGIVTVELGLVDIDDIEG